jgi:hypothetical protein
VPRSKAAAGAFVRTNILFVATLMLPNSKPPPAQAENALNLHGFRIAYSLFDFFELRRNTGVDCTDVGFDDHATAVYT